LEPLYGEGRNGLRRAAVLPILPAALSSCPREECTLCELSP
jgi:hypothetical protein